MRPQRPRVTIVLQNKVPWQTALGMVFWAGVLFLLVSATQLRERIALAIPVSLRKAAAAGIASCSRSSAFATPA